MKPSEILEKALVQMDEGKKWCKGDSARNASGQGSYSLDPEAVSWCSLGAINRIHGDVCDYQAKRWLKRALNIESIGHWNDSAPDFSVIEAGFKAAIELAIAEGQ